MEGPIRNLEIHPKIVEIAKVVKPLKPFFLVASLSISTALAGSSIYHWIEEEKIVSKVDNQEEISIPIGMESHTIEGSVDDINDLRLIINNQGCSNEIVKAIVQNLTDAGIEYQLVDENNRDLLGNPLSTIVTLSSNSLSDSAKENTVSFLAPYQNGSAGGTLALALQKGMLGQVSSLERERIGEIQSGKPYLMQNEFAQSTLVGNIAVEGNKDNSSSCCELSFGENIEKDPELIHSIANGFVDGLVRFSNVSNKAKPYVYRIENGDTITQLKEKNIDTSAFSPSEILPQNKVVLSYVEQEAAFDENIPVKLGKSIAKE